MGRRCPFCGMEHDHETAKARALNIVNLGSLLATHDPWLLPDDSEVDMRAVEVAVIGDRLVKLTRHERLIAATELIELGAHGRTVSQHLGLPREVVIDWEKTAPESHCAYVLVK